MCLGQSTLKLLGSLDSAPQNKEQLEKINMFGLVRMIETAIVNIDRVHILWDLIIAHIDCLANSKFLLFRTMAMDCFSCFIVGIFTSGKSAEIRLASGDWQRRAFSSVLNYLKSPHTETAGTMMNNLPCIMNVRCASP